MGKYSWSRLLQLFTLLSVTIALSCATFPTHLYAHSISPTLIPPPDIGWDSSSGFPPNPVNGITTFTPGGTPGTGTLLMFGKINSFTQGTIPGPLDGGWVVMNASLTGVSGGIGAIHGDFGSMGSPFLDVTIWDSNGTLALGGNLGDFAIDGIIGSNVGAGAAMFTPSAGYLLPDFPTGAGVVSLTFNGVPNWSATSFNNSWTSESKGDIGPVPEPATITLLGTGFLGILGYTWRRFRGKN